MRLWDFVLVALSVAGGIALGDVVKTFIAPLIDWLSKRSIESHKYALELRKLGYARVLDRYEACRTIRAEVAADEESIRQFVELTQWDTMKAKIDEDDRYAPLFLFDDTKTQLDRVLGTSAHLLPAVIIDEAIKYHAAAARVALVTRAVIAPEFKLYEDARKRMMLDWARDYSKEQLALVPGFAAILKETCDALELALGLDKTGAPKL